MIDNKYWFLHSTNSNNLVFIWFKQSKIPKTHLSYLYVVKWERQKIEGCVVDNINVLIGNGNLNNKISIKLQTHSQHLK